MSNILILHTGLTGVTNACLELANRLVLDGNSVFTSSMKDQSDIVSENQLTYLKVNPIRTRFDSSYVNSFGGLLKTAMFSKKNFFKKYLNDLNFRQFDQLIKEYQIELLLIDMELHEYILYAKSQQIPFVLINQWFSVNKTNKNYPPASKVVNYSRLSHSIEWSKSKLSGLTKSVSNHLKTLGLSRRQFILYLGDQLKVNTNILVSYHFPLPFSYQNLPCISMTFL